MFEEVFRNYVTPDGIKERTAEKWVKSEEICSLNWALLRHGSHQAYSHAEGTGDMFEISEIASNEQTSSDMAKYKHARILFRLFSS